MQRLVAETEAVHDAAAVVLDHCVGVLAQPHHEIAALGPLEVDGDRHLVAVDRGEVAAESLQLIVGVIGADDSGVVAVEWFDLDDLRTLVGQKHRAERARQHLREVDDANSIESTERALGAHLSPQ